MGTISGGMFATILVLHIVTNQVQAQQVKTADLMNSQSEGVKQNLKLAQRVIDTWRGRAEACEAKFAVGTIVYQSQPAASLPLLHGLASLEIAPGGSKASLYIPAQVDIYTYRSDVRYEWIDGHTGQSHGTYAAKSPAEAQ